MILWLSWLVWDSVLGLIVLIWVMCCLVKLSLMWLVLGLWLLSLFFSVVLVFLLSLSCVVNLGVWSRFWLKIVLNSVLSFVLLGVVLVVSVVWGIRVRVVSVLVDDRKVWWFIFGFFLENLCE